MCCVEVARGGGECVRWRRLYCCDAVDSGGNSSCKTWFDSLATLLNSSSSAASHSVFVTLDRFHNVSLQVF